MEKVKANKKSGLSKTIERYALLVFTIIVAIVFTGLQPAFVSVGNVMNIISSTVVLCIASLGLSLVMITGEIDFACGSELAAGACILAVLAKSGMNYFLALLISLLFCALIGCINGSLHTRVGIPGFIATMGVSFILDGFNKMITGSSRVFSSTWGKIFVAVQSHQKSPAVSGLSTL